MLIDTHTHLYSEQFDNDRDEMILRAIDLGVERMYLPNIDSGSIESMLSLEKNWSNNCFAMMGLHPCSVKEDYQKELEIVEEWLGQRKFAGIGEIGVDLYWDRTFEKEQIIAFEKQISWANSLELPIIIHSRESLDLCIDIVEANRVDGLKGIFHCFSGTADQARRIIDLDFLMGIGGVSTFKNGGLDKFLHEIPLQHIVLETDSPYLAPVPYRGKRNESSYIKIIAERVSDLLNISMAEVELVTSENALNLFKGTGE